MAMGFSGTGGPKPEINVTPMIDVLLVLIIIFMLIQPHDKGLPSEVPQNSTDAQTPPRDEKLIVLEITSGTDNKPVLRINTTQVPKEQLEAKLREIYVSRPEKILFLKGDARLEFMTVAEVIDIARSADAGIRVGLITRELANGD